MSRVQISDFTKKVLETIRSIPAGKVATYKQVAALAGKPQGSRGVAWILHSCSTQYKLPWFRVLNASGRISFEKKSRNFKEQKRRLEKEGVVLDADGALSLARFQWKKQPAKKKAARGKPQMFSGPEPARSKGASRPVAKSVKKKTPPPFEFVLDELVGSRLGGEVRTNPMFGCLAIYVGEKLVFMLRSKRDGKTERDNGLWVATAEEGRESLLERFPDLREIELFHDKKKGVPSWWNLPEDSDGFEESAIELCGLAIRRDPRIGKVPKAKKGKKK